MKVTTSSPGWKRIPSSSTAGGPAGKTTRMRQKSEKKPYRSGCFGMAFSIPSVDSFAESEGISTSVSDRQQ